MIPLGTPVYILNVRREPVALGRIIEIDYAMPQKRVFMGSQSILMPTGFENTRYKVEVENIFNDSEVRYQSKSPVNLHSNGQIDKITYDLQFEDISLNTDSLKKNNLEKFLEA